MNTGSLDTLPTRAQIAHRITQRRPPRDTLPGWHHFRDTRGLLVPPPMLTPAQWRLVPQDRRTDFDLFRRLTNVNLPIQDTPMSAKVSRLIHRRLLGNALKQDDPTLSGIMVSGSGNHGKTATVCSVGAFFEDMWLDLHQQLNPTAIEGTIDLHAPVVYVQTPVTATPKSLCQTILAFFGAASKGLTLPQLIRQVSQSLQDHGVRALIIDDINRLRMHRSDDQDVLDLIRSLMSFQVTLILTGVNIPGLGLLREAKWDPHKRQWKMPPLETTRVHGLEVTQTERRFEMVELGTFGYSTDREMQDFLDHLQGIEDHLRLHKAFPGMLTEGLMPGYLYRRCKGVVGILARLIADGAQEAMDSGRELLDENLLDEIVIGRENRDDEETRQPQTAPKPGKGKSAGKRRNSAFDDHGPEAATG
ncbi:AAA family ATPase [Streptomyces sp. NPDC059070]|uniref:AAA family ATPase n=1 Tax=Streptomyces sp. NPDC059070 TaxID=3346713 RepID=UPI0036A14EC8